MLGLSQDNLKDNRRMIAKSWYDANVEMHKEKKCKDHNDRINEQNKDNTDLQNFTLSKEIKWNVPGETQTN